MEELKQFCEMRRRALVRCLCGVSVAINILGRPSDGLANPAKRSNDVHDFSRIVSVGGTVTEILFDLGLGAAIVGVDTSSVYPPRATRLPQVGYQRALAAEGILSLKPTVVVITSDAGPPPVLAQLRSAAVPLLIVPADATIAAAEERIRLLGDASGRPERAAEMVRALQSELRTAESGAAGVRRPKVLFVYARGSGSLNVSGRNTAADQMIELAGGANVMTSFEGFRPLNAEALIAAAPDVLLLTTRGLESVGGIQGLLELPGVAQTPAGKASRVVAIDDLLLLGFGPRTGKAVGELSTQLRAAH